MTSQVVGNNAGHVDADAAATAAPPTWPAGTDLVLSPHSNRLSLSSQNPEVSLVLHDTINNVLASLLLDHAFPEGVDKVALIRRYLLEAAEKYKPRTSDIHERLLGDPNYVGMMIRLVGAMFFKIFSLNLSHCSHGFGFHCSE